MTKKHVDSVDVRCEYWLMVSTSPLSFSVHYNKFNVVENRYQSKCAQASCFAPAEMFWYLDHTCKNHQKPLLSSADIRLNIKWFDSTSVIHVQTRIRRSMGRQRFRDVPALSECSRDFCLWVHLSLTWWIMASLWLFYYYYLHHA